MLEHNSEAGDLLATDGQRPLVIIASNRGPYTFKQKENGTLAHQRGSGGLVTALGALAEKHAVLWVAGAASKEDWTWAEQNDRHPAEIEGILLKLVQPGKRRYEQYYNVIANPLLWFIQHQLWDVPRTPSITRDTWNAWRNGYVAVNKLFADEIADEVSDSQRPVIILPQDYHLYLVPHFLRERLGYRVQIQPFVHIPWPGPDAWRILPEEMRTTILSGLLASDRIGFQTQRDAFNFVQCCRFFLPDAHSQGRRDAIYYHDRKIEAKTYPISIDVEKLQELIEDPQIPLLKSQLLTFVGDKKLILRVDRIEPSKNILRGLEAFRALLRDHPEHRSRIQMLALLVPSRMEVEQYQDYFQDIMAQAGIINAEFNDANWEPVRIMVGENYMRALAAMQLYDVLLVNPIADGMNLVAKEGALVNQRDGVILLSEYAGAYYELGEHSVIVAPFDIHSMAEAMHTALTMSVEERHQRAEALRQQVSSADVKNWFYGQIEDALTALSNQAKNASTAGTPSSSMSA